MGADTGRTISSRHGVGTYATVVQAGDLGFDRIFVDQPTLIVVRHGVKSIRTASEEWLLRHDEAIVLTGGRHYDFRNSPAVHGTYEARWLFWDPALLALHARPSGGIEAGLPGAQRLGAVDAEFLASFARAGKALCEPASVPPDIARHRAAEMLVWLALRGVRFAAHDRPSLQTRVRRVIEADPARQWTIDAVARQFAVSGTSLKRHLAAEGTTLGALLIDTRMSLAVTLLQSTHAPVRHIALDLGYESASRFSISFRERFGFPPTAIRGHARGGSR